ARLPVRGEHSRARGDPAHPDDRARRGPHARDARPRVHDRARHGRRRLGHSRGRRAGPRAGPTALHRRAADRPDWRPQRFATAVEEAAVFKKYVCAHAYAAEAVARAVENGVRVIEHGNLIDASTAKLMAARGAFLVPTLVAYDAIERHGGQWGMSGDSLEKNK